EIPMIIHRRSFRRPHLLIPLIPASPFSRAPLRFLSFAISRSQSSNSQLAGVPSMQPLHLGIFLVLAVVLPAALAASGSEKSKPRARDGASVRWKKIVVDREFRSEGVAVADVSRDGKPDIVAGNLWYE